MSEPNEAPPASVRPPTSAVVAEQQTLDVGQWLAQNGVSSLQDLYRYVTNDPLREELSRVLIEIESKHKLVEHAELLLSAATRAADNGGNGHDVDRGVVRAQRSLSKHYLESVRESLDKLKSRAEDLTALVHAADEKKREEMESISKLEADRQQVADLRIGLYAFQNAVREFMLAGGQPVPAIGIALPSSDLLKLRMRMIGSEYFEGLFALCTPEEATAFEAIEKTLFETIDKMQIDPSHVDVPAYVDASLDMDYLNEGLRIECGVDGVPLAHEVCQKNLAKVNGPGGVIRDERGKIQKPPGWTPPDIAGLLMQQGWIPPETPDVDDASLGTLPMTEAPPLSPAEQPKMEASPQAEQPTPPPWVVERMAREKAAADAKAATEAAALAPPEPLPPGAETPYDIAKKRRARNDRGL